MDRKAEDQPKLKLMAKQNNTNIKIVSSFCYTWRLCSSAKTDLCGLPGKLLQPHLSNGPKTRGSSRRTTTLINIVLEMYNGDFWNSFFSLACVPLFLWFPLCFARNLSVKLQIGWNNAWTNIEFHILNIASFLKGQFWEGWPC